MKPNTLIVAMSMLASTAIAHADRGIAVTLGAGAAHDRYSSYHRGVSSEQNLWGVGVRLDVTYRVIDELAVGVHFAFARSHTENACLAGTRIDYYSVTPAFLGATASYTILDRVWLAPWIGVADLATEYRYSKGECDPFYAIGADTVERRLAYGIGVGVDLFRDRGHRFGPFLQLARAREEVEVPTYPSEVDDNIVIAFGIAYRFW